MKLSVTQAVVLVVTVVAIAILAGLHLVDGAIAVPILATLAGNALGYVNGTKNGRSQVRAEVAGAVKAHLDAAAGTIVVDGIAYTRRADGALVPVALEVANGGQ